MSMDSESPQTFKDAHVYFVKPLDQSTNLLRCLLLYMTLGAAVLYSTNMPGVDAALPMLFKYSTGLIFLEDHSSIVLCQIKLDSKITDMRDADLIKQAMAGYARGALVNATNPRPITRIILSFGSEEKLSYSKSTITLDNRASVTTHDFWCGGIGDYLLPHVDKSKSSQKTLLSATMKSKELFEEKDPRFKDIAEERKYMAPGGSRPPVLWSWCEDTDDDL